MRLHWGSGLVQLRPNLRELPGQRCSADNRDLELGRLKARGLDSYERSYGIPKESDC